MLCVAGGAAYGMYRGVKLWEADVKEAGKLDRDAVAAALDHAKIAEGPGGPAEMVPGQRHCKMKMYTAGAKGGNYEIVAPSAALFDPKGCETPPHGNGVECTQPQPLALSTVIPNTPP